jgi:2-polyprenyl-3-methyl-5-hydroxy-6-metoxy-1,4-benzoquinol methylase
MSVYYDNCPLCNSGELADFLVAKDHLLSSEEFTLIKCNSCGFVFTQNVPSPDKIGAYYQSQDYVSHSDTRKGLMNKLYHLARNYMLGKKFRMVRKVAKGKKLLDIGCGTGYFPAYMKRKGYEAVGVEVDEKARNFASKEFGLTVHSPDEFLNNGLGQKFDVITLWHVLEHLDDFNNYIEKMLEHLEKDGSLVIALPNCSSLDARFYKEFWAGYDVPRHLWHFTPSTFNILAKNHNLELVKMKRLPLDPFYNSMLSEKYRKNKLYMFAGLIIGKLAYLESLFNLKKSSSIVYFLNSKSVSI